MLYQLFYLLTLIFIIMRRNLLLASAACLLSMGAMAQDFTPTNWKFSQMEIGSADGLFIREMASTNWNCKAPFKLPGGYDGGIVLANYVGGDVVGPATDSYAGMSDADKATFEEFYKSCQIVDGGALGHLFCYQGKSSSAKDSRITNNPKSFPNATLFWLSNTDPVTDANYRLTINYRVVSDYADDINKSQLDLTIAGADYYGIDAGTDLGDGYRTFALKYLKAYPEDWITATLDITIKEKGGDTNELPLVIKMWLGACIEQGLVFFRDIKLEKITTKNNDYVPGKLDYNDDWDDTPTGITQTAKDNQAIILAKNGEITVVDAISPIAVYSISGQLIAFKAPIGDVTTISVAKKGVYIVKIGDSCRKVVL